MKFKLIIVLFFLLSFSINSIAQETMEEIKEMAKKLFDDEKYLEATPFYLRLLATEPRDHNYNYRYGTCLLYNTSTGQDVFKYLNYAVTNDAVEVEANYFLAKAFHLNYQFNDAIKYYKIYQTKAGENAKAFLDVQRQIEMCENGKRLITTITEMIVVDKKEIEMEKFFRIYDLSDIGGNLLVTADFQTKIDEKKAHTPLIHFPSTPTVIYYSSYGETGKTGKDIYVRRRLPTGGWGVPQALKGDVNTAFDEDYPYMHPDGKYLYFSSKGHNSMGGFDVFRCKYNEETDDFGKAENMDYAVSSPDDDLFYVVDSLNRNAYFGSGRQSEEGKLFVYKVRVDRVPLNMSVIKGEFSSTINPGIKKVLIAVKDFASGEFIGNFNSNEKGVYLITFPKGGKYEFTIKVGESPQEYKYICSVPFQKEFKPLKQKIIHAMDGERENVKVVDLFNEEVEDPQAVFAQVLKLKAVLTPNISQEELDKLDKERKSKEVLVELGIANLSLVEVGYLLEEEVKDAKKAQSGTKEIENKINTKVLANIEEIKKLDNIIKMKLDRVNLADTDKKKYRLLKDIDRSLKVQEDLKKTNEANLKYADSLSKIGPKGSDAATAEITRFSEQFNELMNENKQAEAYAMLYENKVAIKKILDEKTPDPLQEMVERSLYLDKEITRLQPKDDKFVQDLKKIEQEISQMESAKQTASKKELLALEESIKSKKKERAMVNDERDFNGRDLKGLVDERSALRKKIDVLEGIYTIVAPKEVTKTELKVGLEASNATNTTQLREELGREIASLVLKNPDVKEVDYSTMEAELGAVATKSKSQSDKIMADATLSPEEKANRLKAVDRELLTNINNEIIAASKALNANPNDAAAKSKLDALQSAKSLVSASLDIPEGEEDEINRQGTNNATTLSNQGTGANKTVTVTPTNPTNAANPTNPTNPGNPANATVVSTLTPAQLIESVNSMYDEKVAAINSNSNLSESDKLTELQQVDKELLASIDKEVAKQEGLLAKDVANKNLQAKVEGLKSVQKELNSDISARENAIASEGNNPASATATAPTPQEKEALIEAVSSSYNEKVSQINANGSLSAVDKLNQLQQADKELLKTLTSEVAKTETESKKNPGDRKLLEKLADLKVVQSELESAINSREKASASAGNNSATASAAVTAPTPQEKEALIETARSSYNEKVSQINANGSLSAVDKLNQLQQADKELLKTLTSEVAKTEAESKKNPGDQKLLEKLTDLKVVQSELESAINSREKAIASAGNNSATASAAVTAPTPQEKEALIETASSYYNEKVSQINANSSLSTVDKLNQLQQADKELLKTLTSEVAKTEAESKKNPGDQKLLEKLVDLKVVQSEVESTIASREKEISSSSNSNTSSVVNAPLDAKAKEKVIESVSANYNEKVAEINSNATLSEADKLKELQKVDKELLVSVEAQVAKNETVLKANSSDLFLAKKVSDLKIVEAELEGAISIRETVISSGSQPLTEKEKTDMVDALSPMYNVKVKEVNNNKNLSETEKLKQLQQADKDLIGSINKEISALEKNIKNNPDPQLNKELADFKTLKSELETAVVELEKEISAAETTLTKNPNDAEAKKKVEGLKAAQSDSNTEISARETAIASGTTAQKSTSTPIENEKLIESVNPSYNQKVAQIKENSSLSESDKLIQLQQTDKELVATLSAEISKLETQKTSNPSTGTLASKIAELNDMKAQVESSTTARDVVISSTKKTVDAQVKADVIKSVDSKYAKKIDEINANNKLSVTEKLDQLQELDYALVESLKKEITATEASITKNPSDEKLVGQLSNLNAVKSEVEVAVGKRESVIASAVNGLDENVKTELIESVNSSYNETVAEIKNNEYLLENEKLQQLQTVDKALLKDLQSETKSLESKLVEDPNNPQAKRKVKGLKTIENELQVKVDAREKILAAGGPTNELIAKSKLVETFFDEYAEKVKEINADALTTELDKMAKMQALDKEVAIKLDNALAKATTAAKSKKKDEGLQKTKNDLADLKVIADKVIAERSVEMTELLAASVTAQQKEALITDVKPGHTDKMESISNANSDQSLKLQEQIKEEKVLLTKLEVAEKSNQAILKTMQDNAKKVPVDEAIKEKGLVIAAAKIESENKITVLSEQAVTLQASSIDQTALVEKVDPTFDQDIKTLSESNSSTKSADLAAREVVLQDNIEVKVAENASKMAANYNVELAAENRILTQKLKESEAREERFKGGATTVEPVVAETNTNSNPDVASKTTPVRSATQTIEKSEELRKEVMGDSASELTNNYTELADLKKQDEVLTNYSTALKAKLDKVNSESAVVKNDSVLVEQRALLQSEIGVVEAKRASTTSKIEKIDKSSETALMSPELKVLMEEEAAIKAKLENTTLSKKEKGSLEKELVKVQTEKSTVENGLITENLAVRKADSQARTTELEKLSSTSEMAKVTTDLAVAQNTRLTGEVDALVEKADKTKNPIEKNVLLKEAIEKQVKADDVVKTSLEENKTRAVIANKVSTLDSKAQLEEKKSDYGKKIDELAAEIGKLDVEISAVKPKQAVPLNAKRDALITEKTLTEKQLDDVNQQINELVDPTPTLDKLALEQAISFNEEKRIVASKEYLEYSINANKALRTEKQISDSEVVLADKRQKAKDLIAASTEKNTTVTTAQIDEAVNNVKVVEDEIKTLSAELAENQKVANSLLGSNNQDAIRMQNMVKRGVEAKFVEELAQVERARTPAVGLTVVAPDAKINTYSEANPIPVDVKNPIGLVYRIQVGAFSKPILQDMYKSFNPVSGEKLSSGITRYMAGYFNKAATVDEAHLQVKDLGYSDAFIVAYCDNKRIPVAEARQLEASGQCISTESREFIIATANVPKPSTNTSDLSYNEAPGAAKAIPVEVHLGLFYTVQVGVYNKPASSKQLKEIDPLVTKRLPNGQIRYSTGMFSSVDAAQPQKSMARGKGVKDAFITAYFNGERLTLSQASRLLKQKGEGILEKLDGNTAVTSTTAVKVETPKEQVKTDVPAVTPKEEAKVTTPTDAKISYNKAAGAVPAMAAEAHLGLFFTVQIGVYSKPATKKQLNYVSPLITKKLPNGQIRYSSGMFKSVEEAEPKRLEALEKGVNHAYVTAYYKGERITIAEAKALLLSNGESILEK